MEHDLRCDQPVAQENALCQPESAHGEERGKEGRERPMEGETEEKSCQVRNETGKENKRQCIPHVPRIS